MAGSFSSGETTRDSASREAGGLSGPGPESQNAGGRDNDPSDRNRFKTGERQMRLPAEYADFILEDGRRLEDVLGKSFFKGGGKLGRFGLFGRKGKKRDLTPRERLLAERRAQAKRLNQTKAILTGAQGVAGAANTAKKDLSGG